MYRRFWGVALLALLFTNTTSANERMRFFDEQIMPFVKEMQMPPQRAEMQSLQELLKEFKALEYPRKEIVALDPMWLRLKLSEAGVQKAVIGLCGAELPPCHEVADKLQRLTSECSGMYLGIIDVEKHPATPRDFYDAHDPTFIMLLTPPDSKTLSPIGIRGVTTSATVAIAMCPEEKFNYIFRTPGF